MAITPIFNGTKHIQSEASFLASTEIGVGGAIS